MRALGWLNRRWADITHGYHSKRYITKEDLLTINNYDTSSRKNISLMPCQYHIIFPFFLLGPTGYLDVMHWLVTVE